MKKHPVISALWNCVKLKSWNIYLFPTKFFLWKAILIQICFRLYAKFSNWFFFQDLKEVQTFIYEADFALYQYLIDILLPKVLKPIPNALTQGIRTFSKNLETWMVSALTSVPDTLKDLKVYNNTVWKNAKFTLTQIFSWNQLFSNFWT